jgi:hypothetical protein
MRKRRTSKVKSPEVTAEMLAAWRTVRQIKRRGSEAHKAALAVLNNLCGLTKFDTSPAEVGAKPPAYFTLPEKCSQLEEWRRARKWRDALDQADREQPKHEHRPRSTACPPGEIAGAQDEAIGVVDGLSTSIRPVYRQLRK